MVSQSLYSEKPLRKVKPDNDNGDNAAMEQHLIQGEEFVLLAPVVQKVDSAIHWINSYPVDKY